MQELASVRVDFDVAIQSREALLAEVAELRKEADFEKSAREAHQIEAVALRAEVDRLRDKVTAIVSWLDKNQPDVYARGIWDAINAVLAQRDAARKEPPAPKPDPRLT